MPTPPFKNRGDQILASEWNDLIRQLIDAGVVQFGTMAGGSRANRPVPQSLAASIGASSTVEVPAFSAFVLDDSGSAQPIIAAIRKYDASSGCWPPMLFTNGDSVIPADGHGTIWPLAGYQPHRVAITGDAPEVGAECGVEPDTWGVSANGGGLVCAALEGEDFAWVYSVPRAGLCLFRLTESVSPGGSAMGDLQYWDGSDWADTGQEHELFDSIGDKSADASRRAWCEWSSDSHRFEIIQLYCL